MLKSAAEQVNVSESSRLPSGETSNLESTPGTPGKELTRERNNLNLPPVLPVLRLIS